MGQKDRTKLLVEETLEAKRQALKEAFDVGKFNKVLVKRYFVQLIKEQQVLIETPRGFYYYQKNQNRYVLVTRMDQLYVWLHQQLIEVSPEAEDVVQYRHLQTLANELKTCPYLAGSEDDFDTRSDLINTKCGLLKLSKDGNIDLLPYDSELAKFRVFIDCSYITQENRTTVAFQKLISGCFPVEIQDEMTILLLQNLGYLYSNYRRKYILFVCGDPDTGKTTLMEWFQKTIGGSEALEEGIVTRLTLHDLGRTAGTIKAAAQAMWMLSGELSPAPLKKIDYIKMISSNDGVEECYAGKSVNYKPKTKIWVCGNFDSLTAFDTSASDAIKARLITIPFLKQNGIKKDDNLLEELLAERDSIFSYAVDALLGLMKNDFNFSVPNYIDDILEEKLTRNNSFLLFLKEHGEFDGEGVTDFDELYKVYEEYSDYHNRNIMQKTVCRQLFFQRTSNYRPTIDGERQRVRKGYSLSPTPILNLDLINLTVDTSIDIMRANRLRNSKNPALEQLAPSVRLMMDGIKYRDLIS